MLKLFHTSDIHIGARNKYLGDKLFDEQKKFLKRLYNNARDEDVKYIVIAGDVFDSNYVGSNLVEEFFEIIGYYNDIYTVIIPGGGKSHRQEVTGHDAYTMDSVYRRPDVRQYLNRENIIFLSPDSPSKVVDNIAFYGGFFEIPNVSRLNAAFHIGVVHGPFSDVPKHGEISVDELESMFFDYICLGHYHSFKKFNKCAYSGSLVQYEFSKKRLSSSGYICVTIGSELNIDYRIFKDAPGFYKKEILDLEDIKWIEDKINKGNFVEIIGYVKELKMQVENLLENPNIRLSDGVIEYERDGIYGIIEDTIDEILSMDIGFAKDLIDDIKVFILKNIRGNLTKPKIEEFLKNKYLSC